jgi:hypothetical protein
MQVTEINIPLLRKVLEYADAHPEEVDLEAWASRTPCGTTACIAGITAILTGHEIDWSGASADEEFYDASYTTNRRFISSVAIEELGLNGYQEDMLFYCNTLDEVWEAAEYLTGGEVKRLP